MFVIIRFDFLFKMTIHGDIITNIFYVRSPAPTALLIRINVREMLTRNLSAVPVNQKQP